MCLVLSGLPVILWYWRASLSADSTASEPPLVKNTRLRSPGRETGDPGRQLDRARVRVGPVGVEAELLGLVGSGLDEVRATVTDVDAEQGREPVEVAVALVVVDVAALAPGDDRDVTVRVGAHPREVHPEVTATELLERARFGSHCLFGARHAPSPPARSVGRFVQRYRPDGHPLNCPAGRNLTQPLSISPRGGNVAGDGIARP